MAPAVILIVLTRNGSLQLSLCTVIAQINTSLKSADAALFSAEVNLALCSFSHCK